MNNLSADQFSQLSLHGNGRRLILNVSVLVCFPLLMLFPKWAGWLSALLAVAGLATIIRYHEISPVDRHFLIICLILPLSYIWNMAIAGWYPNYLSRPGHLLWAFALYFLVGRYGISRNIFFYSACLAAFAALGIALYEAVYLGNARVFGLGQRWNAVPFGNFSIIFGFFCLSGVLVNSSTETKFFLNLLLGVAGFFSGLAASILSETRGGWIALPFLIAVCIFMNDRLSRKLRVIIFLLITVTAVAVPSGNDRFHSRMDLAKGQVKAYVDDPHDPQARSNAVGLRLAMWHWGIEKFIEHPFTGIGIANYKQERKAAVETGELPKEFNKLANLHNELITSLALGGIPSAVALVLFWILGWKFFYSRMKTGSEEQRYFALCGLITIVGTAFFSMTEGLFGTSPGTKAIMLCLAFSAGGLRYLHTMKSQS